MKRIALLFSISVLLFFVSFQNCFAQKNGQDLGLAGYNLGLGVVSTTIGALINKPKGESVWKCIKKASWQGALGGALQYGGKKLVYQITRTNDYYWGWGTKIIHSAGVSICQNASMGNPYNFGNYWVLDYAALHLTMAIKDGNVHFQPQFNLLFVYDVLDACAWKAKVDWRTSLQLGAFTFAVDQSVLTMKSGFQTLGETSSRSIVYAKENPQNELSETLAHELVHVCQVDEYRVMNTYFDPLKAKITNKTVNSIFKYLYVEFPFSTVFYGLEYNKNYYWKNLYEFEAESCASNAYINRNLWTPIVIYK